LHKVTAKRNELALQHKVTDSDRKHTDDCIREISALKYNALDSKRRLQSAINEAKKDGDLRTFELPLLSLLSPDVEELQRQIALHNVSVTDNRCFLKMYFILF